MTRFEGDGIGVGIRGSTISSSSSLRSSKAIIACSALKISDSSKSPVSGLDGGFRKNLRGPRLFLGLTGRGSR